MRIRPATPRDVTAIATIHVETWQVVYRGQVPDEYLERLSVDAGSRHGGTSWRRRHGRRRVSSSRRPMAATSSDSPTSLPAAMTMRRLERRR